MSPCIIYSIIQFITTLTIMQHFFQFLPNYSLAFLLIIITCLAFMRLSYPELILSDRNQKNNRYRLFPYSFFIDSTIGLYYNKQLLK